MKVDAFGFCSVSLEFFDIQGSVKYPTVGWGPTTKGSGTSELIEIYIHV
jgi:hypothetical protein